MKTRRPTRTEGLRPKAKDVLQVAEEKPYDPLVEISEEEKKNLIRHIESKLEDEDRGLRAAWLFDQIFPGEIQSHALVNAVRKNVSRGRIRSRESLSPSRREEEAFYYFVALMAARKFLPDLTEYWPEGKMDQLALRGGEAMMKRWTQGGGGLATGFNTINVAANRGLVVFTGLPEFRTDFARVAVDTNGGAYDSLWDRLESVSQQPLATIYDLEAHALYRMLQAFVQAGHFTPLSAEQLEQAKSLVRSFRSALTRDLGGPLAVMEGLFSLQVCLADRLEFPSDGPVQRVSVPRGAKHVDLPERLKL